MTPTLILFIFLAILAVASALGMLFTRNAVIAALFLVFNFMVVAVMYVILEAPFIAVAQVTVYAGAIMVLFLFVIMLLGAEETGRTPPRWWLRPFSLGLGLVFLVELLFVVWNIVQDPTETVGISEGFGSPLAVGELLFTRYAFPFEATSILLLVAMIGVVVLTRFERK